MSLIGDIGRERVKGRPYLFIKGTLFFFRYNSVDVNVAVATKNGLITPIVFGADTKVSIISVKKKK
jgi:hypothetical protein